MDPLPFDFYVTAIVRDVEAFCRKSCEKMKLAENLADALTAHRRQVVASFPLKMDNGEILTFDFFRAQHNNDLGAFMGGLRLSPDANLHDCRALSMLMSWKFALLGLPYGGASGAIVCDPARLSPRELKSLLAGYVSSFAPLIGPNRDILSPETGLSPRERGWILDALSKQTNASPNNALVGKSPDLFGWNFYDQSIPFGAFCILKKFLATQNKTVESAKIAIQGFGTVGHHIAKLLEDQNAIILAISEKNSAIYCSSGIDIEEAGKYYRENKTLEDLPGCESITNEELLTCECEILIPCAAENAINAEIAPQIQAHAIVEAANEPISPEADEILLENGVTILPDILAAAGEALAGHFELQNRTSADDFQKTLEQTFDAVNAKADQTDCDYRAAAYAIALDRIAKALKSKM